MEEGEGNNYSQWIRFSQDSLGKISSVALWKWLELVFLVTKVSWKLEDFQS